MTTKDEKQKNRPYVLYCQGSTHDRSAIQGFKVALPFSILFWVLIGLGLYWLSR